VKRGELWWARLPLPAGRRPVVLLSRDVAYAIRQAITVAEVSTVIRSIPSEVPLGRRDGLPRPCVINTDNLATIPKGLLVARIASLSKLKLEQLEAALRFSLGLETPE
jgi:mRNA interferase MazF